MTDGRPLCIDLFCGRFGWGRGFRDAGFRVVGVDNDPRCASHADGMEFLLTDILHLTGEALVEAYGQPAIIVASPPCEGFSLAAARWHRPPYGFELWRAALRIADEARAPIIIENVRGAIRFFGPPVVRRFPWYLWGNVPNFIIPTNLPKKWNAGRYGGKSRAKAAIIPYPLARALAEACLP